jgi:hypothetical protein
MAGLLALNQRIYVRIVVGKPIETEGVYFLMRFSHSARGHPTVPQEIHYYGAMHKWEKQQVHAGIRRFYKSKAWLRGAIADTDGLNPSKLRVQLSP